MGIGRAGRFLKCDVWSLEGVVSSPKGTPSSSLDGTRDFAATLSCLALDASQTGAGVAEDVATSTTADARQAIVVTEPDERGDVSFGQRAVAVPLLVIENPGQHLLGSFRANAKFGVSDGIEADRA